MSKLPIQDSFITKRRQLRDHDLYLSRFQAARTQYGVVFPGHGSQYLDMFKDLRWENSTVKAVFDEADEAYFEHYGTPLSECIYSTRGGDRLKLAQPTAMQCSVFTASVAQYRRLLTIAPEPTIVLGHSLGEFAAYVAGGILSFGDGLAAVMARAEVLSEIPEADRGAMVAVTLQSASEARSYRRILIQAEARGVIGESIANSPVQSIVSGSNASIAWFCSEVATVGLTATRLRVTHAFHSPILRSCVKPLERRLAALDFRPPVRTVMSTITEDAIEASDVGSLPTLLAAQLIRPFTFPNVLRRAIELGVEEFIEPGPSAVLTKIIDQSSLPAFCVPFDSRQRSAELNERSVLLYLASLGLTEREVLSEPSDSGALSTASTPVGMSEEVLTKTISRVTGYPTAVLDPTQPLELLGLVDSTKVRLRTALEDIGIEVSTLLVSIRDLVQQGSTVLSNRPAGGEKSTKLPEPPAVSDVRVGSRAGSASLVDLLTHRLAQATGYPMEVIEPDLDLEADLGIDSVKQAQVIAAVARQLEVSEQVVDLAGATTVAGIAARLAAASGVDEKPDSEAESIVVESTASKVAGVPDLVNLLTHQLAQATGYPMEVIEPDLDLEADLGIDSVKQAQVIAAVARQLEVSEQVVDLAGATTVAGIAARLAAASDVDEKPAPEVQQVDMESRAAELGADAPEQLGSAHRYVPRALVRDLRVDEIGKRSLAGMTLLLVACSDSALTEQTRRLAELGGATVWTVTTHPTTQGPEGTTIRVSRSHEKLRQQLAAAHRRTGAVTGIVYLAGVERHVDVLGLPCAEYVTGWQDQYALVFAISQEYYADLAAAGEDAVFATLTNTGGAFGLKMTETGSAFGALAVGFVKSLAKEIPTLRLCCVDINRECLASAPEKLVQELTARVESGDDEVAYIGDQRHVVKVITAALGNGERSAAVPPSAGVVVFSGGSRGITLECAVRLAKATSDKIVLLGRSTLDDPMSLPYLHLDDEQFAAARSVIMGKLHDEFPGQKPMDLQLSYRRIDNNRKLYQAMQRLRAQSLSIEYMTCDIAEPQQVSAALADVTQRLGRIRGIVHGAGLESLGLLPKKNFAYSQRLVDVKVSGLFNLVHAVNMDDLDFFYAFTSISGRFGMDGQTDYTAASAMVSALCGQLAHRHRSTSIVAMDWTAWAGTGMAMHQSVREVQENERGLAYMDMGEGCDHFLRELSRGGADAQVMVFGPLGTNEPRSALDCLTLDRRAIGTPVNGGSVVDRTSFSLIDTVVSMDDSGKRSVRYGRRIDPRIDRFMVDHLVKGAPTLPAVFHLEAMAQATALATGWEALRIDSARFERFVKCRVDRTCDLTVEVSPQGDTVQAKIQADVVAPNDTVLVPQQHRSGAVFSRATRPLPRCPFGTPETLRQDRASTFDLDAYYAAAERMITFGPGFRLMTEAWRTSQGLVVGLFDVPENSRLWLSVGDARLATEPVLIDNVGRLALMDVFDQHGDHVVPVELTGAVVERLARRPGQVLGCVEVRPEDEGTYSLEMDVMELDGTALLHVDRILLQRIGHDDPRHSALSIHH